MVVLAACPNNPDVALSKQNITVSFWCLPKFNTSKKLIDLTIRS